MIFPARFPLVAALAFSCLFAQSRLAADESVRARPDPKRFAKDIAKFGEDDAKTPPGIGGIVFTGSSSIRLWTNLKQDFPGLPVLNRGFGGSVANDLTVYAEEVVLRYQPKVLVIYTGSNDVNAGLSAGEALADYTKFLNLVHERLPETRVIVNSVKVASSRLKQMTTVQELNRKLEAWCKGQPWVTWVEATAYLIGTDGKPKDELFRKDRLHLNPDGYGLWKGVLDPVLRRVWAEVGKP